MKLISMMDYVLEKAKQFQFKGDCEFAYDVKKYANLLKQPLELGMFVPCDDDGNVIEGSYNDKQHVIIQHLEYQQAKDKVLFESDANLRFDQINLLGQRLSLN